jgi:hypothetical protein
MSVCGAQASSKNRASRLVNRKVWLIRMCFQTGDIRESPILSLRGVKRRSNFMAGTFPRKMRDCRSFVTPDSDPGSSLDSRVRGNDDGRDAYSTGDCFGLAPSQ